MKTITTILFLCLVTTLHAQVGVNTSTPDDSAMLDVYSEDKGFLPPRMDDTAVLAITSPATGLVVYNTTENCLQVNTGTPNTPTWECVSGGSNDTLAPGVSSGTCTLEQVAQDTYTQVVELTSPTTGRIWMDRNLGATGPYVQGDDGTYGYYYQWGRGADGHEVPTSGTTNSTATSHIPGHGDFVQEAPWTLVGGLCYEALYRDGNDPCPDGYRIPTEAEVTAEFASFTSGTDRANHWRNVLKIPPAARRLNGGGLVSGSRGDVNASSVFRITITEPTTNPLYNFASDGEIRGQPSHFATLTSSNAVVFDDTSDNGDGNSVRCIKEL